MSLLCYTSGDWLMFLAHYWRSQEPLPGSTLLSDQVNHGNQTETELAMWFNEKYLGIDADPYGHFYF